MRGATFRGIALGVRILFQSTLLMRGATTSGLQDRRITSRFQSTLLMRGATSSLRHTFDALRFQSTLLMRGATQRRDCKATETRISIHAPHARSDLKELEQEGLNPISIHAPHARSDKVKLDEVLCKRLFQSTLLMRGATKELENFHYLVIISIHAPHARSDISTSARCARVSHFNPRSSCEERPASPPPSAAGGSNFNPRSSCEERRFFFLYAAFALLFQSTLLMRGATRQAPGPAHGYHISIHAPHARSDLIAMSYPS